MAKRHPLRIAATAIAAYAIVGLLTYGWRENHLHTGPCDYQGKHYDACVATDHEATNTLIGLAWPVVAVGFVAVVGTSALFKTAGDLAKAVTKWP